MKKIFFTVIALAFVVACGDDDAYLVGSTISTYTNVKLNITDMPELNNVEKTICYDRNLNGLCDLGEPVIVESDNNKLIFYGINQEDLFNVPVIFKARINNRDVVYKLPAGFRTLNPITALFKDYIDYQDNFNYKNDSGKVVINTTPKAILKNINLDTVIGTEAPLSTKNPIVAQYTAMNNREYLMLASTLLLLLDTPPSQDEYNKAYPNFKSEYDAVKLLGNGELDIEKAIKKLNTLQDKLKKPLSLESKNYCIPYPKMNDSISEYFESTYNAFLLDLLFLQIDPTKDMIVQYFGTEILNEDTANCKANSTPTELLTAQTNTYNKMLNDSDSYFNKSEKYISKKLPIADFIKDNVLTVYDFCYSCYNNGKKITDNNIGGFNKFNIIATRFNQNFYPYPYSAQTDAVLLNQLKNDKTAKLPESFSVYQAIPIVYISPYFTVYYASDYYINPVRYSYIQEFSLENYKSSVATGTDQYALFPDIKDALDSLTFSPSNYGDPTKIYIIDRAIEGIAIEYDHNLAIGYMNDITNIDKNILDIDLTPLFVGSTAKTTYGKVVPIDGGYNLTAIVDDSETVIGQIYTNSNGEFDYLPLITRSSTEKMYSNALFLPKYGRYSTVGSGKTAIRTFKTYKYNPLNIYDEDHVFKLIIFDRNMYNNADTELVFILSEVSLNPPVVGFNAKAAKDIINAYKL